MPRPLPDEKEKQKRAAEVDALVAALGGRNAAVRAATFNGAMVTPDTLKKISSGLRMANDDLLAALRAAAKDWPRWLVAKDKSGQYLIHNHNPAFTARLKQGEIIEIRWHAGKPSGRQHGDLLTQAREFLDNGAP